MDRVARDLFLYRFGLERCYRRKTLLENPGWNWTDLLKLAVSYKMRPAEEFTFIQVGAFDGVSNDPIHGIVRPGSAGQRGRIRGGVEARFLHRFLSGKSDIIALSADR